MELSESSHWAGAYSPRAYNRGAHTQSRAAIFRAGRAFTASGALIIAPLVCRLTVGGNYLAARFELPELSLDSRAAVLGSTYECRQYLGLRSGAYSIGPPHVEPSEPSPDAERTHRPFGKNINIIPEKSYHCM